jgi:hypothetical protein
MKSYKYDNETWTPINDPVPPLQPRALGVDDLPSPPRGKTLSTYGFSQTRRTTLVCRAGSVNVYARNHEKLNAKRQVNEFPYDFLCEFTVNASDVRVWIVDFPLLLKFLSQIEAHPEPIDRGVDLSEVHDLISIASSVLNDFYMGNLEITVKPPIGTRKDR